QVFYHDANKAVMMTGGSTPLDGGNSSRFFNDLWSFDGRSWKMIGNAGDERSGIAIAFDTKRNKLYSYGGFSGDNASHAELRVLVNGKWETLTDIPEMKASEPGLVYDSHRDKLIAFGGSAGRGLANNITWEWDGVTWKKFEGPGPEARQGFAMVYDTRRKKTVLYGGGGADFNQSVPFTDTWEFDGTAWTKITKPGPGKRLSSGFAYDEKRGLLVLFGGLGKGGFLHDTWGWDGNEWKMLSDAGPSKRAMGYMAYDKNRDRIVLFGGRLGWPNDANDTWEWDGMQWTEVK
ncbi:MAG TPA: hypothetical protein VK484_15145, partial [Ferruginibacter sp.]|nr:hypothetical protein [Ferruginibacter sp.]